MSNLQTALTYARLGYYVHPLKPGDKIPIAEHGSNSATRDEDQIRAWWVECPNANVGYSLDKTGLVDIAPDCKEWAERFKANGMPRTTVYTSGNGWHALYRLPRGGPIARINVSKQYDIMSQGNAVAPGSLHPNGSIYTARTPVLPVEDLPLAPQWAIGMLQQHVNVARNEHTPADWTDLPSGATLAQSRRFQALCKVNDQLRAVCAGEAVILTTKSGGKDSSTSIQRSVFVNQLIRAKYPHNEIRALAEHFSGVLESNPKHFADDIDRLLFKYTPADYAPESTGVLHMAPRGGRHYEITAGELLDRYHEHADCGVRGIVLDWTVEDAAARLGVSTGTIKRREAELAEAGEIRREYGYVVLAQAEIRSQPIETRETVNYAEKTCDDKLGNFPSLGNLDDFATSQADDFLAETTIGSQPDLALADAPNVPEDAVCITDHAHAEITHSPGQPPSPWRVMRYGARWALRGPAGECSWFGSEDAANDALFLKTAPDADEWAAAWADADRIMAGWHDVPRWQRAAQNHQRDLDRGPLGQEKCVVSRPSGARPLDYTLAPSRQRSAHVTHERLDGRTGV